ncbi:hypothetical protein [Arsenophonus sp. PmNCSU2021_1]
MSPCSAARKQRAARLGVIPDAGCSGARLATWGISVFAVWLSGENTRGCP